MKHLNYCFKDGKNNSGRERRPYQIENFTIYSFTLDDILKKILHCWIYFRFVFFPSCVDILLPFYVFLGERKNLEKKESERKNYDSHYFKFDWYSQPFATKGRKITNFEGSVFRLAKNIGLTWLKYEMISPCFLLFLFLNHLWVIVHLQAVNKNVLQHQAPFFEKMVVLWCRP